MANRLTSRLQSRQQHRNERPIDAHLSVSETNHQAPAICSSLNPAQFLVADFYVDAGPPTRQKMSSGIHIDVLLL